MRLCARAVRACVCVSVCGPSSIFWSWPQMAKIDTMRVANMRIQNDCPKNVLGPLKHNKKQSWETIPKIQNKRVCEFVKDIYLLCASFCLFWPYDNNLLLLLHRKWSSNWIQIPKYSKFIAETDHIHSRSNEFYGGIQAVARNMCTVNLDGSAIIRSLYYFHSKWKQNLKCMVDTFVRAHMQSPSNQKQQSTNIDGFLGRTRTYGLRII